MLSDRRFSLSLLLVPFLLLTPNGIQRPPRNMKKRKRKSPTLSVASSPRLAKLPPRPVMPPRHQRLRVSNKVLVTPLPAPNPHPRTLTEMAVGLCTMPPNSVCVRRASEHCLLHLGIDILDKQTNTERDRETHICWSQEESCSVEWLIRLTLPRWRFLLAARCEAKRS